MFLPLVSLKDAQSESYRMHEVDQADGWDYFVCYTCSRLNRSVFGKKTLDLRSKRVKLI